MLEHYPFEKLRPYTEETLIEIETQFNSGVKFVLVEAPTGSGKSGFAVTAQRKYNGIVLTPSKILQDQYEQTKQFNEEWLVKGKSSYHCGLPSLSHNTVDQAICCSDQVTDNSRLFVPFPLQEKKLGLAKSLKTACAEQQICPYYNRVYNIGKKPGAILNYDLFFRIKKFPNINYGIDMGDTLILDEAHQLIPKVKEIFGFTCTKQQAVALLGTEAFRCEHETPADWLKKLKVLAIREMRAETVTRRVSALDGLLRRINNILSQEIEDPKKFFIDDKEDQLDIKPLDIRYLKDKIFYPFDRVLMLSATFPSNFREIFGIKEEESHFIRVPSLFPKKKRPTICFADLPLLNRETVLDKEHETVLALDSVLSLHSKDKGIIHTGNYKLLEQLYEVFKGNPRMLWIHRNDAKAEKLSYHQQSKEPTVLVSPSFTEGLDLKDDLARFGVLLKVPFPAMDDYAKRMMSIFPTWYNSVTATTVCQAYGRQVRTETDWARFYILDGMFLRILARARSAFSPYFKESVIVADSGAFFKPRKPEQQKLL